MIIQKRFPSTPVAQVALLATITMIAISQFNSVAGHEEHMEVANKQVTLRDVCANRQVPIISVAEVRRLIADLKRQPEMCPNHYVQSFYELEPILALDHDYRLCSERKFEQIKEYHFRYVNPLVETYKLGDNLDHLDKKIVQRPIDASKVDYTIQLDDYKQEIIIPISLQQFFKAWALQLFTDGDFEIIEQVSKMREDNIDPTTGKKINSNNGENKDKNHLNFNELVYLPRIEGELQPGDADLRDQVTILDLRSQPELERLMRACKRRFKPIYSQLVMPIVRLSKLGYDYVGPKLDDINDKLENDRDIQRWLLLTKICESHGNFELIKSADSATDQPEQLDYAPMYNYRIDGELWVKGAEALGKELDRSSAHNSHGLKKWLYNASVAGRKFVAAMDPHQFAWYRRNQNTLSSGLNVASIASNTISMIWG